MDSLADSTCSGALLGLSLMASSSVWRHLSRWPASNWSLARLASTPARASFQRMVACSLGVFFLAASLHPLPNAATPAAAAAMRHHLAHHLLIVDWSFELDLELVRLP